MHDMMHQWYEDTALTPLKVARSTGFIDWNLQPSIFKHYPEALFSYDFDEMAGLEMVALCRRVTSEHAVGGRPYRRLNTPSAGNLHPLELYVQIRGMKGVISGIYHVDAARHKIVLLQEVEHEGLEAILGLAGKVKGMLFVMSTVPFRSIWKYGERAWRYCFLDAGHQLGALQAAAIATQRELTILSDFDASELGRILGFEQEEHVVAAAYSGTIDSRPCDALKHPLMRVQPTDYCDDNGLLHRYHDGCYSGVDLGAAVVLSPAEIISRRSTRSFVPKAMMSAPLEQIMHQCQQPPQPLVCHTIVLRGEALRPGLYEGGRLVSEGDFTAMATTLLVDQRFVSTSSLVLIVSASAFCADILMTAGSFAHSLHLYAHTNRLGFSGVGAFYDRKLQRFLQTDNYILYTMVLGYDTDVAHAS